MKASQVIVNAGVLRHEVLRLRDPLLDLESHPTNAPNGDGSSPPHYGEGGE